MEEQEDSVVADLLRFIPQYLKGFHTSPANLCGICSGEDVQDSFIGRSDSIMKSLVQSLVPFDLESQERSCGGALVICSGCATLISSVHEGVVKLKALREEFTRLQGLLAEKVVEGTGKVLKVPGEVVSRAKLKWKKNWSETKHIYPDLVGTVGSQLIQVKATTSTESGQVVKTEVEYEEDDGVADDTGDWDVGDVGGDNDDDNGNTPLRLSSPVTLKAENVNERRKLEDPKLIRLTPKVVLTRVVLPDPTRRQRRCRRPPPGVLNSLEVLSGSSDEDESKNDGRKRRKRRGVFLRAPSPDLDFTLDDNDVDVKPHFAPPKVRNLRKYIRRKGCIADRSSSRRPQNKALQKKISLTPFHIMRPKSVKSNYRFPCAYCPHTFPLLSFLRTHELSHLGSLPFPCSHCDFRFLYALSLRKHVIGQHSLIPASSPQCELCLRHFHKRFALQKHQEKVHSAAKIHNKFRCFVCRTVFESQEALKAHESSPEHQESIENSRNLHCTLCKLDSFSSVEELQIHLTSADHQTREDEEKVKPFPQGSLSCKVCGDDQNQVQLTSRKELIVHHMSDSHKEKMIHFLQTSISKPLFICKECGKSFDTSAKREHHQLRAHHPDSVEGGMTVKEGKTKSKRKAQPENLKCDICQKEFHDRKDLRSHRVSHRGEKPFKCDVCAKGFMNSEYLKSHRKTHDGLSFLCDECGKTYSSKESLKHHRDYYHEGKRMIKCPHCPPDDPKGQFKMPLYFRKHLFEAHKEKFLDGDNEADIRMCNVCYYKIPGGDAGLETHMGAHDNLKCKQCGRQFKQTKSLELHLRSHSGERPFLCSVCGKAFYSKHNLDVHLMRHAGDKKFKCDECKVSFVTRPELFRHWKGVMHGQWKRKPSGGNRTVFPEAGGDSEDK